MSVEPQHKIAMRARRMAHTFAVIILVAASAMAQQHVVGRERMPASALLLLDDALSNDTSQRPIRFWVVAGRSYRATLAGEHSQSGTMSMQVEAPDDVEVSGESRWSGSDAHHDSPLELRFRGVGRTRLYATAIDESTGFASRSPIDVMVEESDAALRHARMAAHRQTTSIDAAPVDATPVATAAAPSGYSHVHGIVFTYKHANGQRYPLRGIEVELWDADTNTLLAGPIHSREHTTAGHCGLSKDNYLDTSSVYHSVDSSGVFDFGNVSVGAGRNVTFRVRLTFYADADGTTAAGTNKLTVTDPNGAPVTFDFTPYAAPSGTDVNYYLTMPSLGRTDTIADEATHVFYDLSRAYGYFRDCAGFTTGAITAAINVSSTATPYSTGDHIYYNGWTNDYLTYEKTSSLFSEYAHCVQWWMRGGNFPADEGTYAHGGCSNSTSSDGLMQGWARFVPTRLQDDPIYRWGSTTSTWDIRVNTGSNAACDKDEWTVGAILYDLYTDYPLTASADTDFGRTAATLARHNPNYTQDYFNWFVGDWGRCATVWQIFATHQVAYPDCAGAPAVTTLNASDVASTSAMLNATAIGYGAPTSVWFEFGTDATLSSPAVTLPVDMGDNSTAQNASISLSQLVNNTTYYFRAVAQSYGGTTKGDIVGFRTATPLPSDPRHRPSPTGVPQKRAAQKNGKTGRISGRGVLVAR